MVSLEDNQLEKKSSFKIQIDVENIKVRGGWSTLPFIIGTIMGLSFAAGSWYANLTKFLMQQYNISRSVATHINDIMNIVVNFFPIVGAILADSFVGSFPIINVASFASLLGLIMLVLSTIIPSLRPHPCNITSNAACETPSIHQYVFLFIGVLLAALGFGCTRFMLSSLGAYQFDKSVHRRIFFNVYIFAYEICWATSYATVFLVQEQEKWSIGFAIGVVGNSIAIISFLLGSQYYRHIVSQSNPFIKVAYALMCALIKNTTASIMKNNRIHDQQTPNLEMVHAAFPNKSIRSPDQASIQRDAHNVNNTNNKCWSQRLSTFKEVEDMKKVIKIIPVWSAGIILNTCVAASANLITLQASAMTLTVSPHIKLPPASMTVFNLVAMSITLAIFDCYLYPLWNKAVGKPLKPLQRGGVGHVFVVLGLMGLASVEMARLSSISRASMESTFSAYWLVLPITLLGIGAAYYFPGGLTFHYQEFPRSLKCCSTAMPSIQIGIGFYLSKAVVPLVKRHSSWLPDDINSGRLDLVYWVLALLVAVNFGYFLVCSTLYKYNVQGHDAEPTSLTNIDRL